AFEAVLPPLAASFGGAPDPLAAINRFDALLERLPSAVNLFRLLEARPALMRLLADILSHAPALAEALSRRANLLDGLIDATALDPPPPLAALVEQLRGAGRAADYQARLDFVRRIVGERRFALGVQLIEGRAGPLEIAHGYARVAEAALVALVEAAIAEFEAAHGRVPGSELAILALGRLGGEALTHASDLDLIFLFTGDHRAESNGPRPLGATSYFNRLTQRVTSALSVATAAGPLYDIDTRLRPSGAQGPLAVSFESFARYQREQAWTWEHMALARARPVFGSDAARGELARLIADILAPPRDPDALLADVRKMRADIAVHKPPAGSFDVKLVEGGLVDLEFCVHLIQLRDGVGLDPRLWIALAAQIAAGLVAPALADAHDLMTRLLVTLRLVAPASTDIAPASRPLVARACGRADWQALVADYEDARAAVREEWRRLASIED
ncbi:MAG: glutamine-synthetase adenylyltransferase, partial [Sphingomonadaceae bacterium]|nr:glutamine-synthetase adenylyltransferase [Sphingomonadaceae bacterium]